MAAVLEKFSSLTTRIRPLLDWLGPRLLRLVPGGAVWKYLGYIAFFFASLVFFFLWTFPVDALKETAAGYVKKEFQMDLAIGELSLNFPLGIHAEKIGLYNFPDAPPNNNLPIKIESLSVNVGLFSALFGAPSVKVEAELFGGEIHGSVVLDQEAERYEIDLDVNNLRYEKIPAITNTFKELPVTGGIDFSVQGVFDQKNMKNTLGSLRLAIRDGQIGPGKYGVELPKMVTGNMTMVMEIKDRKATITEYTHESPDVSSDMQGYIQLFPALMNSRSNLVLRFKLGDQLLAKNEILRMGMQVNAGAKGSDGYYYYVLRGTLKNLQFQKNRNAQRKFKPEKPATTKARDKKTVRKPPKTHDKPKAKKPTSKRKPKRGMSKKERAERRKKDAERRKKSKFNFPLPGAKNVDKHDDEPVEEDDVDEAVEEDEVEEDVVEEEPEEDEAQDAEPEEDNQAEEPEPTPDEAAEPENNEEEE